MTKHFCIEKNPGISSIIMWDHLVSNKGVWNNCFIKFFNRLKRSQICGTVFRLLSWMRVVWKTGERVVFEKYSCPTSLKSRLYHQWIARQLTSCLKVENHDVTRYSRLRTICSLQIVDFFILQPYCMVQFRKLRKLKQMREKKISSQYWRLSPISLIFKGHVPATASFWRNKSCRFGHRICYFLLHGSQRSDCFDICYFTLYSKR